MTTTVFNPVQLQLLDMFAHVHSDEELEDVKSILSEYYFERAEKRAAELFKEKGWTPEQLEALSHEHFRTPYV